MLTELDEYKGSELKRKLIIDAFYKIPVFRKIRGDGNCFYRAFAFEYLEKSLNLN